MIYRFQSRETSELVMLGKDAERILDVLGKTTKAPGIITWPEIGQAIERLRAAVEADKAKLEAAAADDEDGEEDNPKAVAAVQFAQRVVPFITMLERCLTARQDVVWSV